MDPIQLVCSQEAVELVEGVVLMDHPVVVDIPFVARRQVLELAHGLGVVHDEYFESGGLC